MDQPPVLVLVYSFWHAHMPTGSLAYAHTKAEIDRAKAWYISKYPDLQDGGWEVHARTPGTMRMPDDTFQRIPS